ncbi:acid protease [Gymnopus androsaceus JB14]|uniref:Acid protease n=1 Tax=Gymnopus androsaceus JB14 TaxID=1447944 RepID=A0A6A4IPA3_9AGAR|nr:acid protease [Gymnopus androsaceus JB14]
MRLYSIPLALATLAATSDALKFPIRQVKRSSLEKRATNFTVSTNETLNTVSDLIYIANITLGGVVQLDTGSSDLWIKGSSSPLPDTKQTTTDYNLTYGIGWAYGLVSYATVEFAGMNISTQAYLDTTQASNPALGYGADGIAGLGFTSLSTIDALVNNSDSSSGRSLLYNMFMQDPSEPNFIAFALERSTDDDADSDDVTGSFSIGEYDPAYVAVANTTSIPTWPTVSPTRWSVLLEAYMIGSETYTPTTQVADVASNRAVVVLDTGTSWSYAPMDVCEIIYSGISGAQYSSALGQWVLPCDAEINMALQFGDQVMPLHPLDINIQNPSDTSQCLGTFVPSSFDGDGFDWLLGDNVLRALYSVYDFGEFNSNGEMINPFLKLLSLVDPDEASEDFVKARGGTAQSGITYNESNATADAASVTSVDLSTEVAETLAKIGTYFPAILAIVALNALVLLALAIIAIVWLCKRTKKSKRQRILDARTRTPMGRMSPMPLNARDSSATEPHTYEPISMALTEDTMFVPPSPAFRKFNGSIKGGKGMDRPSSLATLPSQRDFPSQDMGSEDALFGPPSPGFHEFNDNRPRSMGMPSNNPYQPFIAAAGVGGPPQDAPFVPPRSPTRSVQSYRHPSTSSSIAGPSGLQSPPALQEQDEQLTPPRARFQARQIDRPQSMGTPPPMPIPRHEAHPLEEDIATTPPNPSFLRPQAGEGGDRPMSIA